jgi:hypothetical protein
MNIKRLPRTSAIVAPIVAALFLTACSAGSSSDNATDGADPPSATPVNAKYLGSYTLDDEEFGTQVTVTVDGSTRTIQSNALPNTKTGEFPNEGNPNTSSAQDVTYSYTTEPTYVGSASQVRTTGVALNGVKFEPGTAESVTCTSGENFRVEALQDVYNLGLDFNNAHVQPTGEYHYHGVSDLLVDAFSTDDDLVLVGFAADGYLMYYSKSGAYTPGYELSTQARSGTGCTSSSALGGKSVDVEGTTPDGTYTSDWAFSESAGNLDSCNGATINGEYAYVITNAYPFVSRCLNGEVMADAGPPAGGAPPGQSGVGAPNESNTGAGSQAGPGAAPPDLTSAATSLGVSVAELQNALGGPPPDFAEAAKTLGISEDKLTAALQQATSAGSP